MQNPPFSRRVLRRKIREASHLEETIREMEVSSDRDLLALYWAVVADDVTTLQHQAEASLPEEDVESLQASINRGQKGRWERYLQGGRRIKDATGKARGERPQLTVSIAELLRQAPDPASEE